MAAHADVPIDRRSRDPEIEARHLDRIPKPVPKGKVRTLGLGLITGASDEDPIAVGTYASAVPHSALQCCGLSRWRIR